MKIVKPDLNIYAGDAMDLALKRNEARLYKKRIFCGLYKMFPLYVTEKGFELELPDDEPEEDYITKSN